MDSLTWKEYNNIHRKIERTYGYAFLHSCVDCGKRAKDWSFKHNENPREITSYEPRCRSCHKKYDIPDSNFKRGSENHNSKLTEDDVREIRRSYEAFELNQYELAEKYSVSRGLIGQIVRREAWKWVA